MSLDSTILKVLATKDNHGVYAGSIPMDILDPVTRVIINDLGKFYDETGQDTAEEFQAWFDLAHPKLKDEARAKMRLIIKAMQGDVPQGLLDGLIARLEDARHAHVMASVLEKYSAGEEVSVSKAVQRLADSSPVSNGDMPLVTASIDSLLDEEQNDWGFHWRLDCLNSSMRPLRPGDFIILCARIDQGKSSFLASELSHMAPQVDELFPHEGRHIVILNNESLGSRMKTRFINATLNMSTQELVQARASGTKIWQETLKAWGNREVIQIYDVHDRPLSYLEQIIRRTQPAILVVDMLDNVPFDGTVANGGQRTDQILEAAYQRARIWAVKYNCIVIATSQLSATAAGSLYPGLHELSNSRTGKAGAADAVLMIGHSLETEMQNSRWISLPKNKLARQGNPKDPRTEVRMDGARARYLNPLVIETCD